MSRPHSGNSTLHAARQQKRDEFYTQLVDVENELRHYKAHFTGKTVYCNCDDPYESNFFRYFASNFDHLGLKRLIATSYVDSPVAGNVLPLIFADDEGGESKRPVVIDITEVGDRDGDGAVNLADVEWLLRKDSNVMRPLSGDGDFRSDECIELLAQADIVVTNPPFSLFREYVAQLVEHGKKFLIVGNQNAITYKETFALIRDGKLWLGNDNGGEKWFQVPDDYDIQTESRKKIENGVKYISMGSICWFTNLDHSKRHEALPLFRRYTPDEYPHYDNYSAIEVGKVAEIPEDWDGVMGVPITFLDKWCPEQFEIVGADEANGTGLSNGLWNGGIKQASVDGQRKFKRILVKRKDPS